MWLINVDTLELKNFLSGKIPKFASLSHTWGDDEQWMNGTAADHEGYSKIKGCITQAKREGIRHVWVDMCFIDKMSSVELSEAINSMDAWYENVEQCYAYLSDVTSVVMPDGSGDPVGFEKSRWFTRGGTLQELLAPGMVDFFDQGWRFIGTRSSFCEGIHQITNVPTGLLDRGFLYSACIRSHNIYYSMAQRMS